MMTTDHIGMNDELKVFETSENSVNNNPRPQKRTVQQQIQTLDFHAVMWIQRQRDAGLVQYKKNRHEFI